jgi:glycosyltransferase involved in cell wall biosynthesis
VTFLGGAALYRRGYLLEAGNFNPFLRAAEEHELGQRLRLKRYRLISIPEPMIRHYTRTISDWEEFSRKRSAGFYRGIGQAFRCAHAPRFFFELLRYYRQYTFFLALIALTAVFYPAAAFLFVAVILGASLAMRSPAKGCRAVLKWMLMCIEITRGMFTAVPDATRYPSDPETLSGGRVCRLPQTIVCLSPIDWDFLRQRHQILMSGFANQGIRVIYVENMHPAPRVSLGLFARAGKRMLRAAGHIRPREQQENITVITPLVMPFAGRASSLLNRLIFNRILCRRILRLVHNRPLLIWTYCATDTVHDLIGRLCPDSVLYDCVCDASLHPDAPADIVDIETRLVKRSDIVLTDNRLHLQKFKPLNPCTHLVEPGVDEIMFAHAVNAAPGVGVTGYAPAPKLCFFGGINDLRMDFDLIRRVALDRPDWRIILYGPVVKSDISKLKLPNITFAGVVDRCALALRLQEMDVLIMPYRLTGFCSSVFPAKTYECLASGKPVVATPLPELKNLSSFIRCASTPEEFVQKIEDCLSHDTPELRTKRVTVARQNTWDSRLTHIQEILKENLC